VRGTDDAILDCDAIMHVLRHQGTVFTIVQDELEAGRAAMQNKEQNPKNY
jgi:hypothetical protein